MSKAKHNIWLWALGMLAVGATAGFLFHRFQVYVVVRTGTGYARGKSKWFSSKQAAMDFAATQSGGLDFVAAIVADRGDGILEGFHGSWMTGEALDAIVVDAEKAGLKLDKMV